VQVILLQDVEKVGLRGEVVDVAPGFARNYLLPRKLALIATDGNKKQVERERAKFEAKEGEERKIAEGLAARVDSLDVEIARKVGENEVLFGSVTSADVAAALAAKGFDVDRRKLQLNDPIKKLGEYQVPLKLHRDVVATIKVRVVGEGAASK